MVDNLSTSGVLVFPIGLTSGQGVWLYRHLDFLANSHPCFCNSAAYSWNYSFGFDQIKAAVLAGFHVIGLLAKGYSLVYFHTRAEGVRR